MLRFVNMPRPDHDPNRLYAYALHRLTRMLRFVNMMLPVVNMEIVQPEGCGTCWGGVRLKR